ncbi:hypothetical protein QF017_002810 [Pseudomonas laurylsulfatiphila]
MYCRALWSGLCPRGRLRYYAGGAARQVCVCAMWLVVGARCGPAREGGVSGDGDVGCAGLFAGKPAPTGISGKHKICAWQRSRCGSGLAREGGVSGDGDVGCAGLIASRLAPTGDLWCTWKLCAAENPNVGAGLPAKAVCQSILMLEVLASSRASPLPQGSPVNTRFVYGRNPNVGAGLLAKAVCQSILMLEVPASSRASPLPQGSAVSAKFAYTTNHCGSGLARDGCVSGNPNLRSENSPPTDSTARPAAPARYKRATSIANSPPLAGSGC